MKQERIRWGLVLRRSGAFFLAAAAFWTLTAGAGRGVAAGAFQALGEDPDFVTAALRAELGPVAGTGDVMDGMDFWQRLVLRQSAYLRQGPAGEGTGEASRSPAPAVSPAPTPAAPSPEYEESDEPPAITAAPEDIVERTLVPTTTQGYAYADGLYLYNRTQLPVDLSAALAAEVPFRLPAEGPQILIIHTHSTEAYTPDGSDTYTPTDSNSRTLDQEQNVIRVGDEMERVFSEMGLRVLHDKGIYDYPKYSGSYSRSGPVVQEYLNKYPSLRLVLDIHRDALVGTDGTVYKAVTRVDGERTAQVMLVLGSGEGHPDWTQNLALAVRIQKSLDTLYPTLARPMTLRSTVYNQNLSPGSLLVEVGSHGNTLQEALAGARCFARAAGQVFLGLK